MSAAARHDRACAEERHYKGQKIAFIIPLYIDLSPTDFERILEFRNHRHEHAAQYLSKLTSDDCRMFRWKDCAMYGNIGLTGPDHFALLD